MNEFLSNYLMFISFFFLSSDFFDYSLDQRIVPTIRIDVIGDILEDLLAEFLRVQKHRCPVAVGLGVGAELRLVLGCHPAPNEVVTVVRHEVDLAYVKPA